MSDEAITTHLAVVRRLEEQLARARQALDDAFADDPRDPTVLSRIHGVTRQTIYKSRERAAERSVTDVDTASEWYAAVGRPEPSDPATPRTLADLRHGVRKGGRGGRRL